MIMNLCFVFTYVCVVVQILHGDVFQFSQGISVLLYDWLRVANKFITNSELQDFSFFFTFFNYYN